MIFLLESSINFSPCSYIYFLIFLFFLFYFSFSLFFFLIFIFFFLFFFFLFLLFLFPDMLAHLFFLLFFSGEFCPGLADPGPEEGDLPHQLPPAAHPPLGQPLPVLGLVGPELVKGLQQLREAHQLCLLLYKLQRKV